MWTDANACRFRDRDRERREEEDIAQSLVQTQNCVVDYAVCRNGSCESAESSSHMEPTVAPTVAVGKMVVVLVDACRLALTAQRRRHLTKKYGKKPTTKGGFTKKKTQTMQYRALFL